MPVNTSDATIYFLQIYGKRIERLIYCSSAALIKRLAKSGYNSENKEVHMEKEFTFIGGHRHSFTLTVRKTSNGINVDINDWIDDEEDNGGIAE